jgi:hypothetical protein
MIMTIPSKVTDTFESINSSEEDVDSDGCAMGKLSSNSSIESNINNAGEDCAATTCEKDITLDFLSLKEPSSLSDDDVKCFWKMVQQSPPLYTGLLKFHRRNANRRRRLETPSAAAAMDQAEALRTQFTDIVARTLRRVPVSHLSAGRSGRNACFGG